MKLQLGFAICCILATLIQARVFIIDGCDDVTEVGNNINSTITGQATQIRPETSPGVLMNTLHLIYKKIGIFPGEVSERRRVLIRNIYSGNCISMKVDADGVFNKGIEAPCKEINPEYQLTHLQHIGEGYVTLTLAYRHCLGAGYDPWSYVYFSMSDTWCRDSPSHHWAIVQVGNQVVFKQRESKRCLTSWPKWEELFVDNNDCKVGDPYQGYQICDPTGTKCWPPNAQ